jgi:glycosyltransferase involved in cell wall biosynthesis
MKILLCSNYQPPHIGGIEFAAEALKQCWQERGHTVTWLTTDLPRGGRASTHDNPRLPAWNQLETRFQINTPIIPPWHRGGIADLVRDHDAINPHSLAPGLSALVRREALRQGKPLVATQHVAVIPLKLAALSALQEHLIVRAARQVVAGGLLTFVGQAVRDWFVDHAGLPADRVRMTPAGINAHDYYFVPETEAAAARAIWRPGPETFQVLFVGRFYDKKGLPLIREVAAACPDIGFTLVGGGPLDPASWNLPNLRVISRFVSNADLRALYGTHDAFLMPSYGEGWPAVIPQAMACGTPCLISEECFTGYQRDPDRFLVRPRTRDALVETLRARRDAGRLDEPSRRALSDYAIASWSWMRTADTYLDLFREQGA